MNRSPATELERLIELSEFGLDYYALEGKLDDLTELATLTTGKKISLINLIDSYTSWSVSAKGLGLRQMPREDAVCEYTIRQDQTLEITDLKSDDRFHNKDYVTRGPKLQYYYGIPLTTSNGHNLGTLCLFDPGSQGLSGEERSILQKIANQVVQRLEDLSQINNLHKQVWTLHRTKREVSHDIRNPVFGMIGIAHVMEEQIQDGNVEELSGLVDMIIQGGNSLIEMVEDILDGDDIEAEQPSSDSEHVFTSELISQKLNELYQPQARSKNVQLSIHTTEDSANLQFSRARLLQIVGNLLANAIKFTESGGRFDATIQTIQADDETSPNTLFITVRDTGIGIPSHKIEEIKEKKAKSDLGTKGEKGFGFGLALVDHLIEQANGSWDIESEEDRGCTITIEIPI